MSQKHARVYYCDVRLGNDVFHTPKSDGKKVCGKEIGTKARRCPDCGKDYCYDHRRTVPFDGYWDSDNEGCGGAWHHHFKRVCANCNKDSLERYEKENDAQRKREWSDYEHQTKGTKYDPALSYDEMQAMIKGTCSYDDSLRCW